MVPYLPALVPDPYVGRELDQATVASELPRRLAGDRPAAFHVHGIAGIGATALALRLVANHRPLFAHVLPLTFDDPAGKAVPQDQVLRFAIRFLGCDDAQLPASEVELLGRYHRLLAGKRILLVIDGVTSVDQVAPLMPVSSEAMVITTGRIRLSELDGLGFQPLPLGPLDTAASRELFVARCREALVDDAAVAELLRICGGHPMAIQLVASLLAEQPEYADTLLADLRDRGVAALAEESTKLNTIFDAVHTTLPPDLQSAYHRLSLHPGADFTAQSAGVLLRGLGKRPERLLAGLVERNLLSRHGTRYSFHPLHRAHAEHWARVKEDPDRLQRLRRSIVEWYRDQAIAWERTVTDRWRVIRDRYAATPPAGPLGDPDTRRRALDWLNAECANLVAAVHRAAEWGFDELARDLCFPLWTPFHLYSRNAWLDTMTKGIEAAHRLGDQLALMQLYSQKGSAHLELGEFDDAEREFTRSLELARACGHLLGQQSALEWLGKVAARRRDYEAALRHFDESWQLAQLAADRQAEWVDAQQLRRIGALLQLQRGRVLVAQEAVGQAVEELSAALRHFDTTGENDNRAKVRYTLADAFLLAGRPDDAVALLNPARELFAADGAAHREAETLLVLARAEAMRGGDEMTPLRAAEETFGRLGDERADGVRARLRELGH